MPYIQETVYAGKTIEITKHYSARYGKKGISRSKNKSPTPEDVLKVNERNAEANLRRLINNNFGYKDIHLILTYRKELRPEPKEAQKQLEKFLRKLRAYFKKNGQILKYITVTEYKGKAVHHHLIIPSMDMRDLIPMWIYGKPRPTYLDDTGQYGQLASYLIKETSKTFKEVEGCSGKRWNSSKNLIKPKTKIKIIKRNKWRDAPEAKKGYYLDKDSIQTGVHAITGYEYQFFRLIQISDKMRC